MRLTDEQHDSYERNGFLVIDQLADAETLTALRAAADQILATEAGEAHDGMVRIQLDGRTGSIFEDSQVITDAREIVEQILGADLLRLSDMLVCWSPGSEHETPWHQDISYSQVPVAPPGLHFPLQIIQFCMPLDDIEEYVGWMQFLPGRQTRPLIEHRHVSGDAHDAARVLAFAHPETEVADAGIVKVASLPAGGATMHSFGTPHYTAPNTGNKKSRRVYVFNFIHKSIFEAAAASEETAESLELARRK
jgi:ectoine hydroxylase-related dioxygenase (phytanoyl-CoA dioxygenase family)